MSLWVIFLWRLPCTYKSSMKIICFSPVNLPLSVEFSDPARDFMRVEEKYFLPYISLKHFHFKAILAFIYYCFLIVSILLNLRLTTSLAFFNFHAMNWLSPSFLLIIYSSEFYSKCNFRQHPMVWTVMLKFFMCSKRDKSDFWPNSAGISFYKISCFDIHFY